MGFKRKSKALSILLTITMLVMLWPGAAYASPTITNAQMDNLLSPNYIRALVNFSEGLYGDANKTSAVSKDDFALTLNSNGGAVTDAVINVIRATGNTDPAPGDKNFFFFINLTGGPPSGTETIAIRPAVGDAVYGTDEFMTADEEVVFTLLDKRVEFAAGYPQAESSQTAGSKQVQLSVKPLNETVTAYYVVVADGAALPSADQVMAGQDSAGQGAIAAGNQTANSTGDTNFTVTLPADATNYDAWVVIKDAANNLTGPVKIDVRTPDATALAVIGIAIKNQPTDLVYTAGETLDLTGLVATLTYNDSSSEDVAFVNFGNKNITTAPAQGVTLETATHHNQPVVVRFNGYPVYTNNLTVTNVPSGSVCQIGATGYATLDAALAAIPEQNSVPVTVKLLANITDNDGISISRKKITLDLNGKTLSINNASDKNGGVGLHIQLSSQVNVIGTGNLIIESKMTGLNVNGSTFMTSEEIPVSITSTNNAGISADTNCNIVINGNVTGATAGIYASSDNNIVVGGTVTVAGSADHHAVYLNYPENTVSVGSAIVSSGTGAGVYIGTSASNSSVTVGRQTTPGQLVGKGHGIWVRNSSTVTVYGNVVGGSHGLSVEDDCAINVYGDVTSTASASDRYGVYSYVNSGDTSHIAIEGNVAGFNGVFNHGAQSEVTVTGNVTASGTDTANNLGVRASYAKVHVGGNVTATNCTGANSAEQSEITIEGTISATNYIRVKYTDKAISDKDASSTKPGYLQYSSNDDTFVWVKEAAAHQVIAIAVKTQPTDLVYTAGENLDLSGLVVTLTYNDSSNLDVGYEDFSFMNITANPANGTAIAVATHHNKPVAVNCNGQTVYTGNLTVTGPPSTGGGGGGGGSTPVQKDSIISGVVETVGDKALDKTLTDNSNAVLSLAGGNSHTAQISTAVINKLADHEIPFTVSNSGVQLDFAPGSLDSAQVIGSDGNLVEIGAREVTGAEKEGILAGVSAGQSTGLFEIGGKIFDLNALVKTGSGIGQRIESFGKPVVVTIDLSQLGDLTPEQISQLTGVRLEKDEQGNIVPVRLGGKYDPITRTFTFNTDKFSLYTVMRWEQARQWRVIELAVNSPIATVNGSPYTLDAYPQVVNNRTLVPIRFVSEALGAQVTWDPAVREVTVKDADRTMVLTLGSSQVLVDGKSQAIDCTPALLTPGRLYVPLRFISETLGAQVDYKDTKQITVTR